MTNTQQAKKAARGLTLTELLVVIAIIVLVSGAMLPMIRPLLKGRNVREAARIVNVFIAGVQSRAIEKKRPMGVWLERTDHDLTGAKTLTANHYKVHKLYTAEQPAPYAGDSLDARARIITVLDGTATPPHTETAAIGPYIPINNPYVARVIIPAEDCAYYSILNVGEMIQFNHRGQLYKITQLPTNPALIQHDPQIYRAPFNRVSSAPQLPYVVIEIEAVPNNLAPVVALAQLERGLGRLQGQNVPFQIYRKPKRTMGAPIEMPNGTVIDLMLSGIDQDNATKFRYYGDTAMVPPLQNGSEVIPGQDIVIMFDEFGKLDKVHYMVSNPLLVPPGTGSEVRDVSKSSISLFIGRDDLVAQNGRKELPPPGAMNLEVLPPVNGNAVETWAEANLRDTSNIWLSISGSRVTNTPNAGFDQSIQDSQFPLVLTPINFYDIHVRHARQLTRSGLSMGEQ